MPVDVQIMVHLKGYAESGRPELDGEHGATYNVEVHGVSGTITDVWLNSTFHGIASAIDHED